MISIQNLSYSYPGAIKPVFQDVNLCIPSGTLALVTGPSGAGKSTLLRCINGLIPHFSGGIIKGVLRVNGIDPVRASPQEISRQVGFVFQDPEAQFVLDHVEDEIAFALENAAVPPGEMHERVERVLELLGLTALRSRRLITLSGGEQQRTAIAAALAVGSSVLILDEPTSQLDPESADDVFRALEYLKKEIGLTIVLAEHRIERVLSFTDLIIHVEDQRVVAGSPVEILAEVSLNPPVVALGKTLGWNPLPLSIEESLPFAVDLLKRVDPARRTTPIGAFSSDPLLRAEGLTFSYGEKKVLQGLSLSLAGGEILTLMGRNGTGKSTLLRCLVNLLHPSEGRIWLGDKDVTDLDPSEVCLQIGYLPQDPNMLLYADTVFDELRITLQNHHRSISPEFIQSFLERLKLSGLSSRYPRDLSVGERQRVSLGAVTVTQPQVILLDEPTRGLDYAAKAALIEILEDWREEGKAILLVTHDVEFAAKASSRAALMENGRIAKIGRPADVYHEQSIFMPQIAQLFPDTDWLTPDDVLTAASVGVGYAR